jgi:hypothetical protein
MSEMLGRADMLCPTDFVRFVPIAVIPSSLIASPPARPADWL